MTRVVSTPLQARGARPPEAARVTLHPIQKAQRHASHRADVTNAF